MPLRGPRRTRLAGILGLVALLVTAPGVALGQDVRSQLREAEREAERVRADLAEATEAYETTWARIEALDVEQDQLQRQVRTLEVELADAADALTDRAVAMFKRGQVGDSLLVLVGDGPGHAADRAALLVALQRREIARAERAAALRVSLRQAEALLAERTRELEELRAELEVQRERLVGDLDRAESTAQVLRARAARQRVLTSPQNGVYSCIFDYGRTHFRDTWGAPRSGGRRHKGTDVFAAMGQRTYAVTNGVISRHSNSRLGGIGLYLSGDDGHVYYYAHLQRIDAAGAVGRRVEAGDLIAYNGDSGNARGGAPHVHFENHPGGGAPINPYPLLAAACF